MPVIVVINKIDRKDARPDEALTETFDLFCDLGASDEQTDFPTIYAIGKEGIAKRQLADTATDLSALFETIVERIPAPSEPVDAPLQILVHNTIHDEYIGKVAIGRVRAGRVERNQQVMLIGAEKSMLAKVSNLFTFEKTERVVSDGAYAGDIIALSGIDQVEIGDTLADPANPVALARIAVEEPTIRVRFLINTSPFAGQSGKFVTSRHVRERLYKEAQRNIALRVQDTDDTESFDVYGRGELMLSILAETMRREGYELALGMPEVVTKEIDGVLSEPLENVVVDVQDEHVGTVTQSILGERRGRMSKLAALGPGRTRMEFTVPSRGLIGFRSQFLTDTRGTGLLNTLHAGWEPYAGAMMRRKNGAIVSDRKGVTTPYALFGLQTHGELFIGSATDVYEGMIVGEHARNNDLDVNAVREKKLTNIRAAGKDENVVLTPPRVLSIDTGLDWLDSGRARWRSRRTPSACASASSTATVARSAWARTPAADRARGACLASSWLRRHRSGTQLDAGWHPTNEKGSVRSPFSCLLRGNATGPVRVGVCRFTTKRRLLNSD
jgi:GTP-binding protein